MARVNVRLTRDAPARFQPCHGKRSVNGSAALVEWALGRAN